MNPFLNPLASALAPAVLTFTAVFAMVGAGKFGLAKLPMATVPYPGKPSPSQ